MVLFIGTSDHTGVALGRHPNAGVWTWVGGCVGGGLTIPGSSCEVAAVLRTGLGTTVSGRLARSLWPSAETRDLLGIEDGIVMPTSGRRLYLSLDTG